MRPFEYVRSATIDEALTLLGQDHGGTQVLAGGTDLLTLMKAEVVAPARLVDIKRLSEVPRGIAETAQGITLGGLTTLSDIETNAMIRQRYPLLAEAAALAATPQLRNMATLGGNLLQRPRCWYYRSPLFHCWLKGGDTCQAQDGQNQLHALFGGGPCYAVHPSDLAPVLLALEAQVCLRGPAGERTLPLAEFFALPEATRRQETVQTETELLLSVHIPSLPTGTRTIYIKAMERKIWAFALVGVAAVVRLAGQHIEDVRLVLSGVAPIPWRAVAAEQELRGAEVSKERIARAAEKALETAEPLQYNTYKVPLAKSLMRRALSALTALS
jgi:xanthine dehydrogenase YagS FAD-binding subunit